ncbi:MAG: hypothetical protein L6Q71_10145, partial [Planctomycetes bacterium]|nr:hypothetical protein [Planctomycetota bacterium]
ETLERKADIIDRNLNLHINLMSKIELMEAMEMKGVSPELIDQIILEFTENGEKYRHALSGELGVIEPEKSVLSEKEREELANIEKEVFGTVKHFAKGTSNVREKPEAASKDFQPLPTEDDVRRTIEESERMIEEMESQREKELE